MRFSQHQNNQDQSDNEKDGPIPNHTKKLGNAQFATYLKSQPQIAPYIHNIEQYLQSHGHHKFYYNSLLSFWCGRNLQTLERLIKKESQSLKQGKSFLQKINKAVFARHRCLQKIKRQLGKVQHILGIFKKAYFHKDKESDKIYMQYTEKEGYFPVDVDQTVDGSIEAIKKLFMDMNQLRGMTIYIIETIHRWRIQIQEWMDKCNRHSRIDYYINGSFLSPELADQVHTVYQMYNSDTDFIFTSRLKQHIWFQYKTDPLLIRNSIFLVEKPEQKQVLEKYYIQFLFPETPNGEQDTVLLDKCIKCLQMLNFQYEVKLSNLYAQQERLIENYLSLQRKDNEEAGFHIGEQEDQNKFDEKQKERYRGLLKSGIFDDNKLSRIRVKNAEIIKNSKFTREQIDQDYKKFYGAKNPYSSSSRKYDQKSDWVSVKNRGWVFGKQLKKPSSDRIRQIVKKHQIQMQYLKKHKNMVKPFSTTVDSHPSKQSIALAYLGEQKKKDQLEERKNNLYQPSLSNLKNDKQFHQRVNRISLSDSQESLKSSALQMSRGKMHQSMVKFQNQVIFEDPRQYEQVETPRNKNIKRKNEIKQRLNKSLQKQQKLNPLQFSSVKEQMPTKLTQSFFKPLNKLQNDDQARKTTKHKIKINSLVGQEIQNVEKQEINIQDEQKPLNLKQFFQVFRADTTQNPKESRTKQILEKHKLQGSMAVRRTIHKKAISFKSLNTNKYIGSPFKKQKKVKKINNSKQQLDKSKSQKSHDSFVSYKKLDNSIVKSPPKNQQKQYVDPPTQYISLTAKRITSDVLQLYIPHLISQLPISTKSFTKYHDINYLNKIIETLLDPTIHTIIFQLKGQKSGHLGDAIVTQQLSRNLRLRYQIIFIGIKRFELLIHGVSRIAEELLAVTMCEQVVWKCNGDRKDYVSEHFFINIDRQLKKQIKKFGIINILEKDIPSYKDKQQFQRLYLIEGKSKRSIQESILKKNLMNNYRSLVIQCKSLLLASNFKLRSDNLKKNIIENYREQSIGSLYVAVLKKIMTKYHMKQLKIASMSVGDTDQTVNLIKNGPFLRSIFHALLQRIKEDRNQDKKTQQTINTQNCSFTNMTDLLNYLSYRQYSDIFNFSFLNESRFFLNHELNLSQININTSLQFIISSSGSMLILNNYRNHIINKLSRLPPLDDIQGDNFGAIGYLLPTLNNQLQLFLMNGTEYLIQCSETLDLFTYLQLFLKQSRSEQLYNINQIALPDLSQLRRKINNVKIFEGFQRLFPQRQFYSASMFNVKNLWQSFYPNSVISLIKQNSIILDYPLILGFYDTKSQSILTAFLIKNGLQ